MTLDDYLGFHLHNFTQLYIGLCTLYVCTYEYTYILVDNIECILQTTVIVHSKLYRHDAFFVPLVVFCAINRVIRIKSVIKFLFTP